MVVASGDPVVLVLAADGNVVAGPVGALASGDPAAIVLGADGLPIAVGGKTPIESGDVGFVVQGAAGLPVFFPFGAEAPPFSCPNNDPVMLITVTGATGTINWCGETWVLPADSGAEKSVCPTAYNILDATPNNPSYPYAHSKDQVWVYRIGFVNSLKIAHSYLNLYSTTADGFLYVVGDSGTNRWYDYVGPPSPPPFTPTGSFNNTGALSVILNAAGPLSQSAAWFDNNLFGSYTKTGITYSWAKGADWP